MLHSRSRIPRRSRARPSSLHNNSRRYLLRLCADPRSQLYKLSPGPCDGSRDPWFRNRTRVCAVSHVVERLVVRARVPWFSLLMFSRPKNGWAASDEDGKKRCAAEMPVGMSGGRSSTPPCFSPCAYLTPPSDPSADESPQGTSDDAIASPSPRLVDAEG